MARRENDSVQESREYMHGVRELPFLRFNCATGWQGVRWNTKYNYQRDHISMNPTRTSLSSSLPHYGVGIIWLFLLE
ncbi:MAG: hypothetical protein ABSB40_08240 [Nitrososphaeria archaeon]|jgi:hypothetical protein